jgi:hypothetical protein
MTEKKGNEPRRIGKAGRCWCGRPQSPHHPSLCDQHAYLERRWSNDDRSQLARAA